jgi:hypothetical protein
MWLYWIGDFIGAALAGLTHQRLFASKLVKTASDAAPAK